MVGEVRTTEIQDIFLQKDADTLKLQNEKRKLELTCRIKDQKIFDLEQQSAKRSEIDSIRRSRDEEEKNSLKQENLDLHRQLQELKKRVEEFSADSEVDMVESKVCDGQHCNYTGLHCEACHCHICTEIEMLEHKAICPCNPDSQLFGK